MIRMRIDSCEYTKSYKILADFIKSKSNSDKSIADVGCGIGYLSLGLSKLFESVIAIEQNKNASFILNQNITNKKINNIEVLNSNADNLNFSTKIENAVFSFYGDPKQIINISNNICSGRVFIISRNWIGSRFTYNSSYKHRRSSADIINYLETLNINFSSKRLEIEMGQPFKNLDDAFLFHEIYNKDKDKSIDKEIIKSKLLKIDDSKYKYFMPVLNDVSIIWFDNKVL